MGNKLLRYLPRGNTLTDEAWRHRHRIVLWVLGVHVPGLLVFALVTRSSWDVLLQSLVVPLGCLVAASLLRKRRPASIVAVVGLTWCSAALVVITAGSIEAHFHFFIIIGFIALYQDWIPFLWNIVFTVVSHGVGSAMPSVKIFNHPSAQASPWLWSAIHGAAVLGACVGLVIFWWVNEQERRVRDRIAEAHQDAEAEIRRRRFTSDLLVNLARRNQSMLYRQLEIINQLEHKERDPDALAELFRLDHLATRIRRNAENLMVLSGDEPARVWSAPVALRDVVQAAIAETEDLDRVRFKVDELLMVSGHIVTDLTHLLAELTENAVRFSPPDTRVTLSCRPLARRPGAQLLTIEDWGVGMPGEDMEAANELLIAPPDVDLSVAQRLGFHVVSRLAKRHSIEVSLSPTPGSGITAVVVLPAELFTTELIPVAPTPVSRPRPVAWAADRDVSTRDSRDSQIRETGVRPGTPRELPARTEAFADLPGPRDGDSWRGWWDPGVAEAAGSAPDVLGGVSHPGFRNGHHAPDGNGQHGNGQHGNGQHGNGQHGNGQHGAIRPEVLRADLRSEGGLKGLDGSLNGHRLGPPGLPQQPAVPDSGDRRPGSRDTDAAAVPRRPSPHPRLPAPPPGVSTGGPPAPSSPQPRLNRRRPQTHLAPELLRPGAPRPDAPVPQIPDPRPASEALSRYQASRRAAQDASRQGLAEHGGTP